MKRQEYNFPSPRKGRLTQALLSDDDLTSTPFLEINQSSISAPIFYRRSLPRKAKLNERPLGEMSKERQPVVIKHNPEVYENELVVPLERVGEEKKETEQLKSVTRLVVKKKDFKVREIRPVPQLVEKEEGLLEMLPSVDRISVVMAFRGRGDNRLEGLKKCIKCLREQTIDCYIILVEQDRTPLHQAELEPLVDSYLFTYSDTLFNKSWAFNCGAIIAPDELILLHDGDMLASKPYVKNSIKVLGTHDLALPWSKIMYLNEESSRKYPEGPLKATYVSHITELGVAGGSLLVRKDFYLRIGGMDERFEGWGEEDNSFYIKACKMGRVKRATFTTGVALFHHHHVQAVKSHPHRHINFSIQNEYCRWSAKDIRDRVSELRSIGDPLRHVK